jgi:hypothetical protein
MILLPYQCHISFSLHGLATTVIPQEVVVNTHILWHTVNGTIPAHYIAVSRFEYRLSPPVHYPEDVELVVAYKVWLEDIVLRLA